MSSPSETEKNNGHLAYAPKWVRDQNRESSPGIAEGEFPTSEQTFPVDVLNVDQTLVPHSIDANSLREAQTAQTRRSRVAEPPLSELELNSSPSIAPTGLCKEVSVRSEDSLAGCRVGRPDHRGGSDRCCISVVHHRRDSA